MVSYKVAQPELVVYSEPSETSSILGELRFGDSAMLLDGPAGYSAMWRKIQFSQKEVGFIPPQTYLFSPQNVVIGQPKVSMYYEPDVNARKVQLRKGQKLRLVDILVSGEMAWTKVSNQFSGEGYIPPNVNLVSVESYNRQLKEGANDDLLKGFGYVVLGLVIQGVTYFLALSRGGGVYYITWGAYLVGGLYILQGAIKYLSSLSK